MRAALLSAIPGQFDIGEVSIDKPMSHEVLLRTVGSGLCHSDLSLIDGPFAAGFGGGGGAVLGHEAAGVVEAVGAEVSYVRPGDHVIAFPAQFCGRCELCLRGMPALCTDSPGPRHRDDPPRLTRKGQPVVALANLGAFAEEMLVHENAVVKIDPDYPFDRAAIIGCGVATGLGAVINTAAVRAGSSVAVVGLGGVGLSVVQGAFISGARQIIAVDTQSSRFDLATTLGATDCVDASSADPVAAVQELSGGGVDYSFEAIGVKSTIEQCVLMLRRAGTATIVGYGRGQKVELDAGLFMDERRVQGCMMGSTRFRIDLPHYIAFDLAGRLNLEALIESHITLDDVNEGYDAMRRRAITGRRVIMFPQ